ncbi:MAG: hypothetical protein K2N38_09855 [Oscillospiraceae bacterium]|nr:hypothetical protein [Oscillospiraceae bacterium]
MFNVYDPYRVCFFGHREIENIAENEKALERIVQELILRKEYIEFLVCREGEFDILAASVIKRVTKRLDRGNSELTLVLPYSKAEYRNNTNSYAEYFDNIEICEVSENGHYKGAYQTRNRLMIKRSDLAVFCIQRESGGAFRSYGFAKRRAVSEHVLADCRVIELDPDKC